MLVHASNISPHFFSILQIQLRVFCIVLISISLFRCKFCKLYPENIMNRVMSKINNFTDHVLIGLNLYIPHLSYNSVYIVYCFIGVSMSKLALFIGFALLTFLECMNQ